MRGACLAITRLAPFLTEHRGLLLGFCFTGTSLVRFSAVALVSTQDNALAVSSYCTLHC